MNATDESRRCLRAAGRRHGRPARRLHPDAQQAGDQAAPAGVHARGGPGRQHDEPQARDRRRDRGAGRPSRGRGHRAPREHGPAAHGPGGHAGPRERRQGARKGRGEARQAAQGRDREDSTGSIRSWWAGTSPTCRSTRADVHGVRPDLRAVRDRGRGREDVLPAARAAGRDSVPRVAQAGVARSGSPTTTSTPTSRGTTASS